MKQEYVETAFDRQLKDNFTALSRVQARCCVLDICSVEGLRCEAPISTRLVPDLKYFSRSSHNMSFHVVGSS